MKIFSDKAFLPPKQICHMMLPFWDHSRDNRDPDVTRFDKYIEDGKHIFELTSLEDADIAVYPASPTTDPKGFEEFQKRAASKKVIAFFNDDSDKPLIYRGNTYIFRTSFYKSTQKPSEFALPAWNADPGPFKPREWNKIPTVSFCGQYATPRHVRQASLCELERHPKINTKFIRRDAFCAGWLGTGRDKAFGANMRKEYNVNISQGDYVLCARGGGNFSYRIYETMMLGRIPLFVNTDCVLPYDFMIDWKDLFPVINANEIPNIGDKLFRFHKRMRAPDVFEERQQLLRKMWEQYLSPTGFFLHFHKHFGG